MKIYLSSLVLWLLPQHFLVFLLLGVMLRQSQEERIPHHSSEVVSLAREDTMVVKQLLAVGEETSFKVKT